MTKVYSSHHDVVVDFIHIFIRNHLISSFAVFRQPYSQMDEQDVATNSYDRHCDTQTRAFFTNNQVYHIRLRTRKRTQFFHSMRWYSEYRDVHKVFSLRDRTRPSSIKMNIWKNREYFTYISSHLINKALNREEVMSWFRNSLPYCILSADSSRYLLFSQSTCFELNNDDYRVIGVQFYRLSSFN